MWELSVSHRTMHQPPAHRIVSLITRATSARCRNLTDRQHVSFSGNQCFTVHHAKHSASELRIMTRIADVSPGLESCKMLAELPSLVHPPCSYCADTHLICAMSWMQAPSQPATLLRKPARRDGGVEVTIVASCKQAKVQLHALPRPMPPVLFLLLASTLFLPANEFLVGSTLQLQWHRRRSYRSHGLRLEQVSGHRNPGPGWQ